MSGLRFPQDDEHHLWFTPEFLAGLCDFMEGVHGAYLAKVSGQDEFSIKLQRHASALMAVAHLLKAAGTDNAISNQFADLASALLDADKGLDPPLLRSRKSKRGRKSDPTEVWRVRVSVVHAVDALIEAGDFPAVAIEHAVKSYKADYQRLCRPKADLATSIASWRTRLRAGTCDNEYAQYSYHSNTRNFLISECHVRAPITDDILRHLGNSLLKSAAAKAKAATPLSADDEGEL